MAGDLEALLRAHSLQLQQSIQTWLAEQGLEVGSVPVVACDSDDTPEHLSPRSSSDREQSFDPKPSPSRDGFDPIWIPHPNTLSPVLEDSRPPVAHIKGASSERVSTFQSDARVVSKSTNRPFGSKPSDAMASDDSSWARRKASNASAASWGMVRRLSKRNGGDVSEFLSQQKRLEALAHRTRLQKVVQSKAFEWACLCLIFTNSIFLAFQAQARAEFSIEAARVGGSMDYKEHDAIVILEVSFCFAFFVELVMRWAADGLCGFFFVPERSWNVVDTVVVALSFMELAVRVAEATSLAAFKPSTLRLVRSVRVIRVLKVIRVVRFFRELRLMLYAIMRCASLLFWVMMILVLMLFIFGISLTMGVVDELSTVEMWNEEGNKDLVTWFGSLDRAMLHLFQAAFGGKSWGDYYHAIQALPWLYSLIFIVYIVFSILAVVNVITGIFVDSALQCNQNDRDMIVNEEMEEKRLFEGRVRRVFEEMDHTGDGQLSLEDFEEHLDDQRVIAYFKALKLDVGDAKKMFALLDYDGSGSIDLNEFLHGCDRLKGESKAFDQAVIQLEIKHLAQHVSRFQNSVESSLFDLQRKLQAEPFVVRGQVPGRSF